MTLRVNLHERNRRSWNAATPIHNGHKRDQAAFLREGGSTLFPEELALLGDVAGRRLVHLQCNAGQDTLSLAARGAQVTGVDISDEAIAFARELSDASGIPATFVRADLYDWFACAEPRAFDIVFASYGAICWLSDLAAWARGIARILDDDGRVVVVDFHPFALVFDEGRRLAYDYQGGGVVESEGVLDYVGAAGASLAPSGFEPGDGKFENPHPDYTFQWGLGEIVTALADSGLRIELVREYTYANGAKLFEGMRSDGNRWYPPAGMSTLPLMFAVAACANARSRVASEASEGGR